MTAIAPRECARATFLGNEKPGVSIRRDRRSRVLPRRRQQAGERTHQPGWPFHRTYSKRTASGLPPRTKHSPSLSDATTGWQRVDRNTVDLFSGSPRGQPLSGLCFRGSQFYPAHQVMTLSHTAHWITSDRADSYSPAFSPNGKFLVLDRPQPENPCGKPWGPRQPEAFPG